MITSARRFRPLQLRHTLVGWFARSFDTTLSISFHIVTPRRCLFVLTIWLWRLCFVHLGGGDAPAWFIVLGTQDVIITFSSTLRAPPSIPDLATESDRSSQYAVAVSATLVHSFLLDTPL